MAAAVERITQSIWLLAALLVCSPQKGGNSQGWS